MSPAKRGDRVAPPAGPGQWEIKFDNTPAAKGWEELCGGRIWYLVDGVQRTLWIRYAGTGHPKATD